jgi:hypothetical protein
MLAAGGAFETHDSDVGAVFASYRSLHGSGEGGLLNSGFPQRYADALVRSDLFLGGGDTLSLTLFHNEETVRLGAETSRETPRWGNRAGSLRFRSATALGQMELGGSLGYFDTRLPVGAAEPLIATGSTRRLRAWADFERQVGDVRLGYGLQGDRLGLRTIFHESEEAETPIRLRQNQEMKEKLIMNKVICEWEEIGENLYVEYLDKKSSLNKKGMSQKDSLKDYDVNTAVHIAAAIASKSRIYISRFIQDKNVYYTDKDSIYTEKKLDDHWIGEELGQMKLKSEFQLDLSNIRNNLNLNKREKIFNEKKEWVDTKPIKIALSDEQFRTVFD